MAKSLPVGERFLCMFHPISRMEIGWFILACLLTIGLRLAQKSYNYYLWRRKVNEIPGPRIRPIIGVIWEISNVKREDRIQWFQKIANRYKNGIFKVWIGADPLIQINSPENAEFMLRSTKEITKSVIYRYLEPWLGNGLLTSTGEKWFHDRKLLTPAFHFGILEDFAEIMIEQAAILNERIAESLEQHGDEPFDVFGLTEKCALDIICETAMGVNVGAQNKVENEYSRAVAYLSMQAVNRAVCPWLKPDWIYYRTKDGKQYKAAIELTRKKSIGVIKQRAAERQQKLINADSTQGDEGIGKRKRRAFLDLLLETSENNAKPLTIEEIREQVETFMFAGHDTTGSLISWSLFSIGNDEKVQNAIHQELDEVLGNSNEPVTTKQLPQLKYLDRVIKETLRMYPSAPTISRSITDDFKVGKYIIPGGSHLTLQIGQLHRDPNHWENPHKFDPDRFLPENMKHRHPYSYAPFSAGIRNCIGQKFALLETKIVLTQILRKWRVKSRDTHENVKAYIAVILRPHDGIFMNVCPRSHS